MATITIERDEPEKRRARSVRVTVDGRAWLRLTPDELAALGLADGDELDEARRETLEERLARERARLFVVRSLTARAQSVTEIERKLAARGVPPSLVAETVELATSYGYLDDATLAAQLARGHRERRHGRTRAGQALRRRGLPAELVTAALDDAYGAVDPLELALDALGARSFGEGDAGRRRAAAFLARRGFDGATAWAAVHARAQADDDGGGSAIRRDP